MTDELQSSSENPGPAPVAGKKDYTKIIIIGAVVLVALYFVQSFFSPERMVERAIEQTSQGGVDVDISRNGTVDIKGKDGENYNVSAGENVKIPDNWPSSVPVLPDAKLSFAGTMSGKEEGSVSVVYTTGKSVSDVATYYTESLVENGWTIEAQMSTGDGSVVSATKNENETVGIYISKSDDSTMVNVSVQQ